MPRNVEPVPAVLPYVVLGVYVGVKGRNGAGAGAEYVFGALFIIIKINILNFYYKFIFFRFSLLESQ
jgi:prepilin signal peptidase PulO-like enzyme (type II secretory pathway)